MVKVIEIAAPEGQWVRMRRNADELAKMRKAGRVVAEMHEATRAAIRPGVTTAELDRVAREVLDRRGARSNFLNYHGFPAVICTSPNSMIVHGIPGEYVSSRRATSSRSTAGPSSRATTATPPTPPGWARCRPRPRG